MRRISMFLVALAFVLTGCVRVAVAPAPAIAPVDTGTAEVQAFAKQLLNTLQPASIRQAREFCGYIYVTRAGTLASTQPRLGTVDTCDYGYAPATTVASFHTHANYLIDYNSEVPSVDDARASIQAGMGDYLSTPGGRVWFIGQDGVSTQICGRDCVTSDPAFTPDPMQPVDAQYTISELMVLQS